MSTITKERLEQLASFRGAPVTRQEEQELARIALVSLESGGWACEACGGNGSVDIDHGEMGIEHIECPKCYPAPPAPVSVPECFARFHEVIKNRHYGRMPEEVQSAFDECAAMLQGAELVTTAYKLPDDFDFDRFNDVVWLEAVASNPHMHSPTTSTIAMVALELNRKLADGNSPVIPDGWVILPAEPTQAMMNAWLSEVANWRGHAAGYRAMIAAAPQQEAKNV